MAKKKQSKKAPKKLIPEKSAPSTQAVNPEQDVMYKLLDSKIEIPLGLLRQKHIFIATPCYGGQIGEPYFRSMMRFAILCNKYNIKYTISTLANESLVTRGRNTLVSFFMENKDATHLFFIDADIEFQPEDILRMVAYDKPVVVGAYPKKAINWDSILGAARAEGLEETAETIEGHSSNYVVNFDFLKDEKGNNTPQVQIEDNLVKLKDAGTGFMCINRDVIQKMFDKHPEYKYVNDINVDMKFEPYMYALFDTVIDPESRRYLSEDYMFCRTWQNMGGTVYLDPRTALNHVGHYTFRGNIRKLFTGENKYHRNQEIKSGRKHK
tara:strand:+ start:130 stop:1101 length:972 start_codon:yes stop_codon:yes gene_type:complete